MTGKARSNDESFEAFQQKFNRKAEAFMSQNSNIDHGQFFTTPPPNNNNKSPLFTSGGVMDGAIGYNASKIQIVSDTIDIGGNSGKYAGVVILESETGTTDTLSTINNFQLSFQGLKLIAKVGHTITIDNADNIDVLSSITLTNQAFVTLRYDILTNKWKIEGGSGDDGSGDPPFIDSNPLIKGSVDDTKLLRFEIDGFTPATTRVITIPDSSTTMAGLGVLSQTWTGENIFAGNTSVRDTNFFIQNTADITKQLKFNLAVAVTGKVLTLESNHTDNRTVTFPDETTDLGGLQVGAQEWTGFNFFSGTIDVTDDFRILNVADNTKQIFFSAVDITTGQTRTIRIPDSSTIMAGLGVVSQTWTGTNIFAGNTTVRDTNFFIQQTSDITKQLKFDLAGGTTGKVTTLDFNPTDNRTLTFPNATTTIPGLGVVSQTWTGTNIFAGNTTVRDTNFFIQQTADITKQAKFDLVGATTGKVLTLKSNHTDNRTLTLPDSTTTLAGLGVVSQTWTGTNVFAGIVNVRDSNYFIQNQSDNSKQVKWDLSGISTSTIRTLTLPNATTTLAGLGVVSQDWTGTNTFFGATLFNGNVTLGNASTDSVTFIADTIGNITPNTDNTDDLGAPTQAWDFIYDKSGVAIIEGYATGFKPSGQTNTAILFTVPTAGGKTELRASFQTGVSQIIATEP